MSRSAGWCRLQDSRRVARGLNRAALTMDARGVAQLLQRQIAVAGVVSTWEDVMVPVLQNIGRRWQATGEGVEVEHLFAEAAIAGLSAVTGRLDQPRNTAQVLLSCAEEEQHSLPVHALAAGLAERGVSSRQLGARVPTDALAAAVRRTGPAVTLVYASMPVPGPDHRPGAAADPSGRPADAWVAGAGARPPCRRTPSRWTPSVQRSGGSATSSLPEG